MLDDVSRPDSLGHRCPAPVQFEEHMHIGCSYPARPHHVPRKKQVHRRRGLLKKRKDMYHDKTP